MNEKILCKEEAAKIVAHSPKSLADVRWRKRVGLPVIKIGRSLRFSLSDLQDLIERSKKNINP